MPYIPQVTRELLTEDGQFPHNSGELNYTISMIVHGYLKAIAEQDNREFPNYAELNEVIGVLECAKLELYRMVAGPYEDEKRHDNGALTDLDMPKD